MVDSDTYSLPIYMETGGKKDKKKKKDKQLEKKSSRSAPNSGLFILAPMHIHL
jgi:hypothetical protein